MVHGGILTNSIVIHTGPESVIFKVLTKQINYIFFNFSCKTCIQNWIPIYLPQQD